MVGGEGTRREMMCVPESESKNRNRRRCLKEEKIRNENNFISFQGWGACLSK